MGIDHKKLDSRWRLLEEEGKKTIGVTPEYNPLLSPPPWYDSERFKKSQLLAKKYIFR